MQQFSNDFYNTEYTRLFLYKTDSSSGNQVGYGSVADDVLVALLEVQNLLPERTKISTYICGLWCQKQISRSWICNYIPQYWCQKQVSGSWISNHIPQNTYPRPRYLRLAPKPPYDVSPTNLYIQHISHPNNRECHPGRHYWDYYPCALSLIQVTATSLKNGTHSFNLWVPRLQTSCRVSK